MAVVNRYTQTAPPRYTPRTLQELMMVPQYMRQNQDAIELGLSQAQTNVATKVDPLSLHSEEAQMEQQKLYDQITEQADILNKEGFNPAAKSKFLQFNNAYQAALGPTGKLGKINAAKVAFQAEREKLLELGQKMKYGSDGLQAMLNKQYKEYKNKFEQTGQIENFQASLPPAFRDLQEDILEFGKAAGSIEKEVETARDSGYSFVPAGDGTTSLVMVNRDGNVVETSNLQGLQKAKEHLEALWLKPGSEGAKTAEWQLMTPEMIASQINTGLGLQVDYSFDDTIKTNYKYIKGDPKATYTNDFLRHYVKGYEVDQLDPNSALVGMEEFRNAIFENEEIVGSTNQSPASQFSTYEEKLDWYKNNGYQIDEKGGEYFATPSKLTGGGQARIEPVKIVKDPQHKKAELNELRKQNPNLRNLSDQQLITRLLSYRDDMGSHFVEVVNPVQADYKYINAVLFGQEGGEGSTGIVDDLEVTINGETFASDLVYKELGYNNIEEFKTLGKPSIGGFSVPLGKFKATVKNKAGDAQTVFVQAPAQLLDVTENSREAAQAMLQGKAFTNLGRTPEGHYKYMINNFDGADPIIYISDDPNIKNAAELLPKKSLGGYNPGDKVLKDDNGNSIYYNYKLLYETDLMNLRLNDTYRGIINDE